MALIDLVDIIEEWMEGDPQLSGRSGEGAFDLFRYNFGAEGHGKLMALIQYNGWSAAYIFDGYASLRWLIPPPRPETRLVPEDPQFFEKLKERLIDRKQEIDAYSIKNTRYQNL